MRLTVVIPGQPMHQPRHRTTRAGGHMRQYDPASDDKRSLGMLLAAEARELGWPAAYAGPVFVWVVAVYPKPKSAPRRMAGAWKATKPDADNIAKFYLDAGKGILLADDGQVVQLAVSKRLAKEGEAAHVRVTLETTGGEHG